MTIEDEPNNPSDDQTLITGVHGVDVIAGNGSLNVSQNSHVLAVAIIPPQKAQTLGNQVNTGSIVSDAGAEIFAGIRNQSATPLTTSSSIPQLALVVNASDSTTWNANVVFTGQQLNATLTVDASGNITNENGIVATQQRWRKHRLARGVVDHQHAGDQGHAGAEPATGEHAAREHHHAVDNDCAVGCECGPDLRH